MPVNDTTARAIRPAVRDAFAAWLASFEARYPGFRVAGPVVRAWEDRWFGDGFSHLNPAGAERFSLQFGAMGVEPGMQEIHSAFGEDRSRVGQNFLSNEAPASLIQ